MKKTRMKSLRLRFSSVKTGRSKGSSREWMGRRSRETAESRLQKFPGHTVTGIFL